MRVFRAVHGIVFAGAVLARAQEPQAPNEFAGVDPKLVAKFTEFEQRRAKSADAAEKKTQLEDKMLKSGIWDSPSLEELGRAQMLALSFPKFEADMFKSISDFPPGEVEKLIAVLQTRLTAKEKEAADISAHLKIANNREKLTTVTAEIEDSTKLLDEMKSALSVAQSNVRMLSGQRKPGTKGGKQAVTGKGDNVHTQKGDNRGEKPDPIRSPF